MKHSAQVVHVTSGQYSCVHLVLVTKDYRDNDFTPLIHNLQLFWEGLSYGHPISGMCRDIIEIDLKFD